MKILILGGMFPKELEKNIFYNTKTDIQYAANEFQWKLKTGLEKILNDDVFNVSAPFINAYPKGYKKIFIKSFKKNKNNIYIRFNNLWGIRNISRYKNLKKESKFYLKINDNQKYIIVYSPHVPLLKTAVYLKNMDPSIKIFLLLPDMPQFVSLSKASLIYKLFKKYDIRQFYNLSAQFDGYILLTKYMNELVNKSNKKNIIIEGIASKELLEKNNVKKRNNKINVTYTGTLHKKYGVCNLIDAFMKIDNKNMQLNICGFGDAIAYVENAMKKDQRIKYFGQVDINKSLKIQKESNVLVNPRTNNGEYTKYSFPSKNLEYLSTGNPVIAYNLDGIPEEYNNVLFYPNDDSIESLAKKIEQVSSMSDKELQNYRDKIKIFLESKSIENTAIKVIKFIKGD